LVLRRGDRHRYDLAVSDPGTARPAICLNMIVRNEAHIVGDLLDMVAAYVTSWVIVDTGSDDGTQDVIRSHMAGLGIPGELHERPWRNFGRNRSEALALAQGHGDYIWVIDADDKLVGTPDFSRLCADAYRLHYRKPSGLTYWRTQLFRSGLSWRYEGVLHEYAVCDDPFVEKRLDGDYLIESRRLGARNLDSRKLIRDRDLLRAEVERDPDDARSVFYLAQTYFDMGDFANAREWYARRVDLGGWDEEVYYAMFRLGVVALQLGAAWPEVQEAYLQAWEFRPIRAEPLYAIACRYRSVRHYRLGYLFAERAAQIPFPDQDNLFVRADVYAWRASDEQAVCASWIGKRDEAFALWRRLLARSDIPSEDRRRIAANRDLAAPTMIEAASSYPDALVRSLVAGPHDAEVTVSLIVGPERGAAERTLNSFLRCCLDVSRVGRFLAVDTGLSAQDRATLSERYPFLEIDQVGSTDGPGAGLAQVRGRIYGRFWLHVGQGWRFFAPDSFITRLRGVLEAEPEVVQVGVNIADAVGLTGYSAADDAARRTADAGRYVLADVMASGPAMFDTERLDRIGGVDGALHPPHTPRTASLDEVLCIRAV
jgi:glycosyltransferase involved in cell wall biosynthesis